MPISDLPPELIHEHIISNIHDYDSVEACTLVCTAWRAAAQPLIFRDVELADPYTSAGTMCRRFHQLLTMSPHLAQYVTHIAIADGMQERRWMERQERELSFILRLLVNVKHISISFVDLPYHQLSPSLHNSLRTMFSSPHVRDILLRGIRDLPGWNEVFSLLDECTAERVTLYAFTLSNGSDAKTIRHRRTPAAQRAQISIQILEMDIEPDEMKELALWLDNPGACVDMSTLKTFAYRSIRLADMGACSQVILTQALGNLESLQLTFPDTAMFGQGNTIPLDLSTTRHLRVLAEEAPFDPLELNKMLSVLTTLLESSSSKTLRAVTLTFARWAHERGGTLDEQLKAYQTLDEVLSRRSNFEALYLATESEFREDVAAGQIFLQSRVKDMFPALGERGSVHQI